jgi:hypothetical protein
MKPRQTIEEREKGQRIVSVNGVGGTIVADPDRDGYAPVQWDSFDTPHMCIVGMRPLEVDA